MDGERREAVAEHQDWPDTYEAPTVEPLGSVWDNTAGAVGTETDGTLAQTLPTV